MTIRKNILKVKRQMLIELDEPGNLSKEIQEMALLAVSKGQNSDEWTAYMTMFVDDEGALNDPNSLSSKQLARLRGKDNTEGNLVFDQKRAYLAADGTCTTDTLPNFGRNAGSVLDDGLPDA